MSALSPLSGVKRKSDFGPSGQLMTQNGLRAAFIQVRLIESEMVGGL